MAGSPAEQQFCCDASCDSGVTGAIMPLRSAEKANFCALNRHRWYGIYPNLSSTAGQSSVCRFYLK